MANKPSSLCQLVKDKFIGGQENFADTFNWVVSFVNNLKGDAQSSTKENGLIVLNTDVDDQPTIEFKNESMKVSAKSKNDENVQTSKSVFPFHIQCGEDSNIKFNLEDNGEKGTTLTIDVYYI